MIGSDILRSSSFLQFTLLVTAFISVYAAEGGNARRVPGGASSAANSGGTVMGKVVFEGKAPGGSTLPMSSDPKCRERHPKGFHYQAIVVGDKGGLADVFVYISKGLEGRKFQIPKESKAILDQKGCWYYPRVIGTMVGQKVDILNSDPTMHNVNALPEFNAAMPPSVKKIEKTFSKPQVMQRLKCNVHPWMTAYVGVLEHPYYAVTDKKGNFEIQGLPPGKYMLEAWHEKLGTMAREISVGKIGAKVDFKFRARKEGKS